MPFNSKNSKTEMDLIVTNDFPLIERAGTILTGQTLVRGSVVGEITASGKLLLLDKDALDGSQNPIGVLAEFTDASAVDRVAPIWRTGEFLSQKLVFKAGTVVADVQAAMEAIQLWPKSIIEENP